MNYKDIEKKLKTEGQKNAPDLSMDKLLSEAEKITPAPKTAEPHKKMRFATALAIFAIIFAIIPIVLSQTYYVQAETYLYIDVNPSFEIVIQRNNKVKEVIPLNTDAEQFNFNVKNKTVDEACSIIFEQLFKKGYIKDNSEVYLSCVGSNEKHANFCLNSSNNSAKKFVNGKNINAHINMNKNISKNRPDNMSPAKKKFIDEILARDDNQYTKEELQNLSMKELRQILNNGNNGNGNNGNNGKDKTPKTNAQYTACI